jgi:hypothetical protein
MISKAAQRAEQKIFDFRNLVSPFS